MTLAVDLERCAAAIARLDARISVSSLAEPWILRASWAGYARALRLQTVEIDEIDLFSWGTGVPIPGRQRRMSHLDELDQLPAWRGSLEQGGQGRWRDELPFTPIIDETLPLVLRALALVRQYALADETIWPWLTLPQFLRASGLTRRSLPCLTGGGRSFRRAGALPIDAPRAAVRALMTAATDGLELLDRLERAHHDAIRALLGLRRPGLLPKLAALSLTLPAISPKAVA
ncbi:MAG: hypothetical protein JOY99_05650 [Sphingomonadaceae bacterium]|nr:hypothetical protein [Sphingomonadaceae bacterium]